jgi:hypothetical protein
MQRIALLSTLALLFCVSCGDSTPSGTIYYTRPMDPVKRAESVKALEEAPERVRDEVYKTCDKWHHLDHPCVDADVRTESLRCWRRVGIRELDHANKIRIRPRAHAMKVLRVVNLCMEQEGWRKNKPGPDF